MNKKELKYLEEKAKALGKTLLIEQNLIPINPDQVEIFASGKLVESASGEKFKARGIVRKVPVSKFTENLNGRVYPKELDERLIKEGHAEGTLSLADHPEDEGSITRICGVWHNPQIDENYSYGDWYLTGEHGQNILEAIEAGCKGIGISRVGFGEFLEDEKTINPLTYTLERWGDAVMNPSQQVFATNENIVESDNKQIKESVNTNKKIEENIEQRGYDNMDKTIQLVYKNQMKNFLKECVDRKDYKQLLSELQEAREEVPAELPEFKTKYDEMIGDVSSKIEKEISLKESMIKESEENLVSMTEKYQIAISQLDEMKTRLEKASKLIESFKKDKEKDQIFEGVSNDEAIKTLMENQEILEKDRKALVEDIKKMTKDLKKSGAISEQLAYAEKHIKGLESFLAKKGYKFVEEDEEKKDDGKDKEDEKENKDEMDEEFEGDNNAPVVPDTEDDDVDVLKDPNMVEEYDGMGMYDEVDDFDNTEIDDIVVDDDVMIDDYEDFIVEEAEEDEDEEEEDEEKEDEKKEEACKKKDKRPKMTESASKSKPNSIVYTYFKEAVAKYPKLKQIEKEVLSQKSISSAIDLVEKYKGRGVQDTLRLDESTKTKNPFGIKESEMRSYSDWKKKK